MPVELATAFLNEIHRLWANLTWNSSHSASEIIELMRSNSSRPSAPKTEISFNEVGT
jgi:hypothetical protein